jgi:Cu/Ag efflux protein CusF
MKYVLAAAALALATPALAQHGGHAGHGGHPAPAAQPAAQGTGVVRAIDAGARSVTIAHDPIKALNWGAMTMPFKVADAGLLKGVAVGDKVAFGLKGDQIVTLKKR